MAKLYAKNPIILEGDVAIPARTVFDATPAQAKQFDKLGAARPATAEEVKAWADAEAAKNGMAA